ncbi:MAG: hypothetical protein LBF93_09340, partial [Zoogloeaceae bacterium]|nr:hypothetical protein [Zoogloeaceae bacterium]
HAVAVLVLPDLKLGVRRVMGVDHAIAIGVQFSQFPKTRLLGTAEKFAYVVDDAIPVTIQREESIILVQPRGSGGKPVSEDGVWIPAALASGRRLGRGYGIRRYYHPSAEDPCRWRLHGQTVGMEPGHAQLYH